MKRAFLNALALLGIAGPAFAGTVYIPIPDAVGPNGSSRAVKIWLTNSGTSQSTVKTTYLDADRDGTKRSTPAVADNVPAGRTILFSGAVPGKVGLLEIDAPAEVSIDARLITTAGGRTLYSALPVISSANLFAANKTAVVQGLEGDNQTGTFSGVGIVNLGSQAGQCTVKVFRADGSQIAGNVILPLKPLSFQYYADALGALGTLKAVDARVTLSCNQPFYLYGTLYSGTTSQLLVLSPSAAGSSLTAPDSGTPPPPVPPPPSTHGNVFQVPGLFHTVVHGHEKQAYDINLDHEVRARRMVVDMDFITGPWNLAKTPGNHAIIWLYRGKFRGNTLVNVNAFGPDRFALRMNENFDLPKGGVQAKETPISWEQGRRYHLHYVYDAERNLITCELSSGGSVVKTMEMPGTSKSHAIDVPKTGMKVEFGHWPDQSGPEVSSYDWQYLDLRIEFVPF
jgi:hypothetical protein